jgi:hypothetical protein
MTDEQIKQRIAYLVEHGGLADDPLDEIRERVRILTWLVCAALTLNVAQLLARLLS